MVTLLHRTFLDAGQSPLSPGRVPSAIAPGAVNHAGDETGEEQTQSRKTSDLDGEIDLRWPGPGDP